VGAVLVTGRHLLRPTRPRRSLVVRSTTSKNGLTKLPLKGDRQPIGILTDIIYDILMSGEKLDMDAIAAT